MTFQRPGDGAVERPEAQRADLRERRQFELRRELRQQDRGGVPVKSRSVTGLTIGVGVLAIDLLPVMGSRSEIGMGEFLSRAAGMLGFRRSCAG